MPGSLVGVSQSTPKDTMSFLFTRGSEQESRRLADILRQETVGGLLLVGAAVLGLVAANVGDGYASLRDTVVGPSSIHLDLSLGTWAADGLLAIFFFVVGLELKNEFVAGDLRDPRKAAVPMVAAVGGMAVPAAIFLAITLSSGGDGTRGWAIPTATDIAFAVAVLAVLGSHLPSGLRTFLLTLAIVDDLIAIIIIAVVYTSSLELGYLALALVPIGLFALAVRSRWARWWLLIPLAAIAWWCVHESGVHATIAGVLLGLVVPVVDRPGDHLSSVADRLDDAVRPLSAGVAVPIFAFFSAGVVIDPSTIGATFRDPITIGIVAGLVVGKTVGVLGATWLMSTFTRARLDPSMSWWDLLGLSLLAGIGFTVSLLIGELAFGPGSEADEHVKVGVLTGSLTAAVLAAVVLRARERHYRPDRVPE